MGHLIVKYYDTKGNVQTRKATRVNGRRPVDGIYIDFPDGTGIGILPIFLISVMPSPAQGLRDRIRGWLRI